MEPRPAETEWFADETLWRAFYPFFFDDARFAAAQAETEQILRLADAHCGAALDLGCGPGRHASCLAKAGFRVTGVDRSRFLLDTAAQRALQLGVTVEWLEEDMRDFVRRDAFDLAICMLSSFGYFRDDSENRLVLRNACQSLRTGAPFVLDVMGKELLARVFRPADVQCLSGVGSHFIRCSFVADMSQIENEWTLVADDGSVQRHLFRHWVYSARELKLMLREAGFADVAVFGGLDGQPYGLQAGRLVAVARRRGRGET